MPLSFCSWGGTPVLRPTSTSASTRPRGPPDLEVCPTLRQAANGWGKRRPGRPPQAESLPHNSSRRATKLMDSIVQSMRDSGLCTRAILIDMGSRRLVAPGLMCLPLLLLTGAIWLPRAAGVPSSAIRFDLKPIPFQLEHGEVAARHVPATMAGGVAVFDYNRDGRPDILDRKSTRL